ncbi:MAG: cell division protein FtsW, partial [Cyclobacteriaceae bacterium]
MMKEWAYRNLKGDPIIWLVVLLLSMFSIMVVYSATGSLAYKMMGGDTEYYLVKHSLLVFFSVLAMWLAHRIDYRYYAKISMFMLWISVPLLLIAWKFGTNINDASRWIHIPIINQAFQPSDLATLALLITLATMLSKRQNQLDDFKQSVIPMLVWIGVICGLIAMTNISTAALLFVTCTLVLFIGRVPMKYLVMLLLIGTLAGTTAL